MRSLRQWNPIECVQRGARILDISSPGWAVKIDPAILNLESGETCILGQIHGSFADGSRQLFPDSDVQLLYGHGFVAPAIEGARQQLEVAWKKEIAKRLPVRSDIGDPDAPVPRDPTKPVEEPELVAA
ncbi:hypothetical protein C4553_01425 [Candidatus Parcubacteria bacterium]|nr:MAG: hypothetical protein C4553_01425 [Candidatus Parcubacteria bacterium]